MSTTAFIYPGQGAQYPGMGKEFYEQEKTSRRIYEYASDICGIDIKKICHEENEDLHKTEYTQIAMLTTTLAMTEAMKEKGLLPDVNAGLSLGEYNALGASEIMTWEDLFRIVRKRGQLMQNAVPEGGAMAAVIGTDTVLIEQICEETEGMVSVANYNCPGQVVITGAADAVERAAADLKEQGARRVIPLKVSGPFHSPMLKPAGEELGSALEQISLQDFTIPYVTNVTAEYVRDTSQIRTLLAQQVAAPVRWQQSVRTMMRSGTDRFIEVGPGRTLSGFIRKISRDAEVMNVEKTEDLKKAEAFLTGGK